MQAGAFMMDPVAAGIVVGAVALIMFGAAWHKLSEPHTFLAALSAYRLLPAALLAPASRTLPVLEAALGLGLLIPVSRGLSLLGAAGLLTVYALAIAANLLRGRNYIDCGCGGTVHPLSWGLVVRNGVVAAAALGASAPTADRAFLWLDAVALPFGVLAFYITYLMTDELLRQAGRMRRTQSHVHQDGELTS